MNNYGILRWNKEDIELRIYKERIGIRKEWWQNGKTFDISSSPDDFLNNNPDTAYIEINDKKTDVISEINKYEVIESNNNRTKRIINSFSYIEYIENYLKGPITVVSLNATSVNKYLKNHISNNSNIYNKFIKNEIISSDSISTNYIMNLFDNKDFIDLFSEKAIDLFKGSAEIETIFYLKKQGFNIQKINLLVIPPFIEEYGNIPDCFLYLKDIFSKISYLYIPEIVPIKLSFDTENSETSKTAFTETWDAMDEMFKNESNEVIIDLAAGNKFSSIIISLYALFNNKPFYYKHQFHDTITEFPPIGIDWDYNLLDQYKSIIDSIEKEKFSAKHMLSLPDNINRLFTLDKSNNPIEFFPLKEITEKFKEKREMPFGYGESFLKLIENDNLKNYIIKKIRNKWAIMWMGDQIPETVEHSQRHSKRLMEFTSRLVNTIGENSFLNIDFKNSYYDQENEINYRDLFYFILGVAFNIHDLGHTYPRMKTNNPMFNYLDSFPSIVRDLHNDLTLELIDTFLDHSFDIIQELETIFSQSKCDEIREAIKLVSKYHRGYLGIENKSEDKDFIDTYGIDTRKLNDVLTDHSEINDEKLKNIIVIATRWLKFIDATDVQADRIITKAYHDSRITRTKFEILYYIDKIKNIVLKEYKDKDEHKIITTKLETLSEMLKYASPLDAKKAKDIETIGNDIENIIKEYIYKNKKELSAGEYYMLELLDKIAFKAIQFVHFETHRSVASIFPHWIEKSSSDSQETVYIKIVKARDFYEEEVQNNEDTVQNENIEKIKGDIEKEFNKSGLKDDPHTTITGIKFI